MSENGLIDFDENELLLLEGMKNLQFSEFYEFFGFSFVGDTVRGFEKCVVWMQQSSSFKRNLKRENSTVKFFDIFILIFLREFHVLLVVAIKV